MLTYEFFFLLCNVIDSRSGGQEEQHHHDAKKRGGGGGNNAPMNCAHKGGIGLGIHRGCLFRKAQFLQSWNETVLDGSNAVLRRFDGGLGKWKSEPREEISYPIAIGRGQHRANDGDTQSTTDLTSGVVHCRSNASFKDGQRPHDRLGRGGHGETHTR